MSPDPIRNVLIVGGGSAGWMAATMLSRALGKATKVQLVESDSVGIVGVGEATIPPIQKFNRFCEIDEANFLKDTRGTFKVGIEFENWGRPGDRYIHAFGRVGQDLDAVVRMHNWWLLGQGTAGAENVYPEWQDLFLGRAAMDANKFGFDPANRRELAPLLPHAYHFDAAAYGQHLRKVAEARGVERIEGKIVSVERDSESGSVSSVTLESGKAITADFFVDCSGFRSLLLGDALGEEFDDWSHWLPADRAVVVQSRHPSETIVPATRAIAHSVGWQWRIPLQDRVGNGHVFSSAFSDEDPAIERLLNTIDGEAIGEPRTIKFVTGRRKRPWVSNVVALGLSAGFLEPLESTSIHLVQSALERLVEFFPSRGIEPQLRDRFNAQSEREWAQVRDMIIAHYKVNQRDDSEFWKHCAEMSVPDSLAANLELWEARGSLAIDGGHLFQYGSWAQVLIGQNSVPSALHPMTSRAPAKDIEMKIRQIAHSLRQRAQHMPDHAGFVRRYAGSNPARTEG